MAAWTTLATDPAVLARRSPPRPAFHPGMIVSVTEPEATLSRLTRLEVRARSSLSVAAGLLAHATATVGAHVGSASPASAVTASDIVANYARGWVLFGRPDTRLAPLIWRRFDTRAIITPESGKVPRRLRSVIRKEALEIRFNEDFDAVMEHTRSGRAGWLTPGAVRAYREVAALGLGSTVGAYRDGELVGGLWGLEIGRTFGILSMFHLESHAGSIALSALVESVRERRRWTLIDCGGLNENFARYGAYEVPTTQFSELVWQGTRSEAPATGDPGDQAEPGAGGQADPG
jgi:leucyl/phenylalanyl-tRNA--protein transferase